MGAARPSLLLALSGLVLLTSCLKKSLDIYRPADSHEYIELCVQDSGPDCEALLPTVKTLGHDISVLIMNGDTTQEFTAYARAHGLTLEQFLTSPLRKKYARANIFPVGRLTTGTIAALDGKPHQFVCPDSFSCTMDGKWKLSVRTPPNSTGAVYAVASPVFPD